MFLRHDIARPILYGFLVTIILTAFSCSPAKYVPEGDYLLSKNHLDAEQKNISDEQLRSYIIQRPNKRLAGTRFFLFLYNLSNIEKDRWPHKWLRKIGEEPVIYDQSLTRTSTEQIEQFLENKGYYNATVEDSVEFKRRNAFVTYLVTFNLPYRVRNISYQFKDTALADEVMADTAKSLLNKGMRFDKDILQQERGRIENLLKELGYFRFSKEFIFYTANLDEESNAVDLVMHIDEFPEGAVDPVSKVRYHPKYKIDNVYIIPDYEETSDSVKNNYDTTLFKNLFFINAGKPKLKPNPIVSRNYIFPGTYYKQSDVNRTYRNISALNIVRFTNITFQEKDTLLPGSRDKFLDTKIELTQKKLQALQAEIAGTNTSGDLGVRGNLIYSNYNLFRGAEVFSTRLTGAIESLKNDPRGEYSGMNSMKELGAETNIVFPKFFSPFRLESFVKKFAPKTSITISYNYQSRPDFTRSVANSSFSYRWNSNKFLSHSLYPFELSYVDVYEDYSSSQFIDSIKNTPLGFSFIDHMINDLRYTLEMNNQNVGKTRNFVYGRFNIESAGNILNLIHTSVNPKDSVYTYNLLNVPYFQYLLGDADVRYYNVIDKQNKFVYRLFVGVGYPFGNRKILPYEKKYFSGGPNSIRAWNTRDLGPGSDTTSSPYPYFTNKNGDIKLEANIEYRFKLVWKIEAALFFDAGNVWEIRKNEDKPLGVFKWDRFYKEIAIGTGFGARLDFSFFLLRVDVGIKVRDPALPENERWVFNLGNMGFDDLHVKFGIGYPF